MRRMRIICLVLLLGCGTEAEMQQAQAPPADSGMAKNEGAFNYATLAELTCTEFVRNIFPSDLDRSSLRNEFGRADSVRAEVRPNAFDPAVPDSFFGVYYPGMIVILQKVGDGEEFPWGVDVWNNEYLKFPAIGIGTPKERVIDVLGDPQEISQDRLTYNCGIGADQPTTFQLRDGEVTRIHISYYIG